MCACRYACATPKLQDMMNVSKILMAIVVSLVMGLSAMADNLSFNPLTKFRIESLLAEGSAVAVGSRHGVNSPVCVAISNADEADCWWYFQEFKSGQFAIRNASTGQYLAYDDVRSDNPIRRYMHLENSVRSDSALWYITERSNGQYFFQSVVSRNHCFNVRSGSYALGTYSEGSLTPGNQNELFYIYKEDGTHYDQQLDVNNVCGIDKEGFYWTTVPVEHPVVATTDDSNPVYYYITNIRSGLYVTPDGDYLLQSSQQPAKRYYFKEADGGMQIMLEGGGYVSAELPYYTVTSPEDVQVVKGTVPGKDDHVWNIEHAYDEKVAGYAVGVAKCSKNSSNNPKILNKQIYWNDFSQIGICYYSVDGGSTFSFHSKDSRHRDYLAALGLVIPTDSIPHVDPVDPPVDPDDPDDPQSSDLEPLSGNVMHVYRADGKVDAIPQMYISQIANGTDSVKITTLNGGPEFKYARYEVDSLSVALPANLPTFESYKINNKFNPHLVGDAVGVFVGDSLVTINPVCIGKRLKPSFKIDDDVQAFLGDTLQASKVTRVRFDKDVVYTLARRGHTILRRTTEGKYVERPYGRQVTVRATFATDNSNDQEYKVPKVYVTTNDGTAINSKYYWWDGKVSIDGSGVFPSLPETAMQIKGRGNSSWTATGKAPYHMKFDTAIKVLGLTKGKHWNLIANAQTRSMTSNAVAQKVAQLVETAGYNHEIPVELYVNGEYRGSYNLTEKVGFANNSIDLDDETYATMLELDSYYDEAYKFRTTRYQLPINVKEPTLNDGITPLTLTEISRSFNKVTDAMYMGDDLSQFVDLDYLARFLLVDELTFNSEFMHPKSTFCYNENVRDEESKFIFGPCWDFDWGYGYQYNGNYFTYSPTVDFWTGVSMEASTWTRDLRYCGDNFNEVYFRLWHKFMTDGSLQELVEFCQDYYDFAAESFTHDNSRWYRGDAAAYAGVTENAKNWLTARANYIYDYMANKLGYAGMGYLDDKGDAIKVGDVNGDGVISTADLVCVLNYMLRLPNEDFDYDQADVDTNQMITIGDAMAVLNLIGSTSAGSRSFYSLPEAGAIINPGAVSQNTETVTVPLQITVDEGDYSGIQFDLKVPAGMTIEDIDLNKSIPDFDVNVAALEADGSAGEGSGASGAAFDRYRVSIYSSAVHKLPQGVSTIQLQLGWGSNEAKASALSATLANVLFVSSLGEDERSLSRSADFCTNDLTGLNSAVSISQQEGNQLVLLSQTDTALPIYSVDGRIYRVYNLQAGKQTIALPYGIYIINKQKVIVR